MPRRRSTPCRTVALAVVVAAAALALTGCGPDDHRTALAVRTARWDDRGRLVLTTECADLGQVAVQPGVGTEGLPLVTIWGVPTVGRCHTEVTIPVPAGTTRIDDAATGRTFDLPPILPLP